MHRILLALIVLALAMSPLRGGLAVPAMDAGDAEAHCDRMLDSEQSTDHMAGTHDSISDDPGHDQGCGGDCCDGACNACAHGLIALPGPVSVTTGAHDIPLNNPASRSFPGRILHPPFRPPISLLS
ncbi:MAG: hypothetical protein OEU91_09975 [Gammaproteobacteria bacterium]|nr:hypothetical protein [Gammaproteobacteria bacterium]